MKEDGGPAFPVGEHFDPSQGMQACARPGLSMRDWFAGMAMQGILACDVSNGWTWEKVAGLAFTCADAMLKERAK